MFFDPLYFIIVAPALLLAAVAQRMVKSTFSKFSRVMNRRRLTGAQVAQQVLQRERIRDVTIEMSQGHLSDHYDPRSKVLRLSPQVYGMSSLAAVGVAAHEAGHAIQHARGYVPLRLRSALVPVASLGSGLAWPMLAIGLLLQMGGLIQIGIILFSGAVLFQVVTLPVEFNASRRAMAALRDGGLLAADELGGARKVLTAAAMTYVAATMAAALQLLYFIIRARR